MVELFGVELGSVLQLISASGIVTICGFLMKSYLGNKKLNLDAEAILRTHFSKELEAMSNRLRQSEDDHEQCRLDREELRKDGDELRKRIRDLEDHLEGIYRMLVAYNSDKVIELGTDAFPEHIVTLAKRTKRLSEREGKKH